MTFAARAAIAEDPAFIRRVRTALTTAAVNVAAEPTNTDNHDARRLLSSQILANPNGWAAVVAVGVATNPNTGTGNSDPATDDGALEYVIGGLFNAYTQPTTPEVTP